MALNRYVDVLINNKDCKATLKEPLTVFEKDKNAHIYFRLIDHRYQFKMTPTTEEDWNIIYNLNGADAWITIVKPDGSELEQGKEGNTVNNVILRGEYVRFIVSPDLTDEMSEIGIYQLQIHITDKEGGEVTIPSFSFEVKERLKGISQATAILLLTEEGNNLTTEQGVPLVTSGNGVTISSLPPRNTYTGAEYMAVAFNGITYKMPANLLKSKDGTDGKDGVTPTIRVGKVNTLPAGTNATVTATTSNNVITLDFGIPRGADGSGGSGSGHNHTNLTELEKFETGDKAKLDTAATHAGAAHAPSNAEQNVQSDWNVTDTSSDAYIKNKPAIPTPTQIVDNLTSTDTNKALSANQGKILDGKVTENTASIAQITQDFNDHINNHPSGGEVTIIEPKWEDVPKVFFTSDTLLSLKSKADGEAMCEIEYISKTKKKKCYGTAAIQGTSSANLPKKNYTLKLYKDENKSQKEYMNLKGWGNQTKFCLKANYIDTTHTRNVSGARIGYDMVESRPSSSFKTSLQNAPRNGLIEGFPIKVFVNGMFHGIYTWNIPKDTWQFGMDSKNASQMVLCAEENNNGNMSVNNSCQFRSLWNGVDGNQWSVESGTLTTSLKDSFNRCINFVMKASDTEFKNNISQYFDLYSLLDYYCFSYLCCHVDGLAKNMLMVTYDGVIWGASLYDMDSIYGVDYMGSTFYNPNIQCPEDFYENNSLLWQRIEQCFGQELYARYKELRKGALSLGNIVSHVEQIYDLISERDIKEEQDKWAGLPSKTTNTIKRFRDFMNARATYVDKEFEIFNQTPIPIVAISIPQIANVNVGSTETLTVTYTPSDTTEKGVTWSASNGNCTVVNGVVTGIKEGSCVVTATSIANSNLTSSCTASITNVTYPVESVSINGNSSVNVNNSITLTATIIPSNATNKNVTWSVNNSNCTIIQNGLTCVVTGVTSGNSIITVTTEDGLKTANYNITITSVDTDYIDVDLSEIVANQPFKVYDGAINFNTETIFVDINANDKTTPSQNVISIGGTISTWGGKNIHCYYPFETDTLQVNIMNGEERNYPTTYTTSSSIKLAINKNGLFVNGVKIDTTTNSLIATSFNSIISLTNIQIGSQEGSKRSKAIYNSIRIYKSLKTEDELLSMTTI